MRHLLALLVLAAPFAHARLAHSELDPLIRKSELILEATPVKLEEGKATLKILRVIYGNYTQPEIVIPYRSEEHEQRITVLGKDRLLFLKRSEDGSFLGTQYGRSYFEFTDGVTDPAKADLDSKNRGFKLAYPLTMIKLTAAQKKALVEKDELKMGKLKEYIAKIKAASPN